MENKNYCKKIHGRAIAVHVDKVTDKKGLLPKHNEKRALKVLQIKLDKAEGAIHRMCRDCGVTDYSSTELCAGCCLWPWRKLVRS